MLIAAQSMFGSTAIGPDGQVGTIHDLYFDGQEWNVRYLMIDTGKWLPGRQVLLAPAAIYRADWASRQVAVRQTQQEIENSPPVEEDRAVSRQQEAALADYFRWPRYWSLGTGGVASAPGAEPTGHESARSEAAYAATSTSTAVRARESLDARLRSAKEVMSYRIAAVDGEIGLVDDYIVDDETWLLRYLVVNTGNWLPGKTVLLALSWIEAIEWEEERVRVGLSREAIRNSPKFDPSAPINRRHEERLYDYYGREKYWK